jgi:hypothetical protein
MQTKTPPPRPPTKPKTIKVEPDPSGRPWSRCLDQLWRAAERSGAGSINFTPTHHWLPPSSGAGAGVAAYCTMDGTDGRQVCRQWNSQLVAEFREGMRLCFAEALRLGLTVAVRPHLDDGTGGGAWRNGLLFRPAERYGGLSYVGASFWFWLVVCVVCVCVCVLCVLLEPFCNPRASPLRSSI